jgi:hypothetical protein
MHGEKVKIMSHLFYTIYILACDISCFDTFIQSFFNQSERMLPNSSDRRGLLACCAILPGTDFLYYDVNIYHCLKYDYYCMSDYVKLYKRFDND